MEPTSPTLDLCSAGLQDSHRSEWRRGDLVGQLPLRLKDQTKNRVFQHYKLVYEMPLRPQEMQSTPSTSIDNSRGSGQSSRNQSLTSRQNLLNPDKLLERERAEGQQLSTAKNSEQKRLIWTHFDASTFSTKQMASSRRKIDSGLSKEAVLLSSENNWADTTNVIQFVKPESQEPTDLGKVVAEVQGYEHEGIELNELIAKGWVRTREEETSKLFVQREDERRETKPKMRVPIPNHLAWLDSLSVELEYLSHIHSASRDQKLSWCPDSHPGLREAIENLEKVFLHAAQKLMLHRLLVENQIRGSLSQPDKEALEGKDAMYAYVLDSSEGDDAQLRTRLASLDRSRRRMLEGWLEGIKRAKGVTEAVVGVGSEILEPCSEGHSS